MNHFQLIETEISGNILIRVPSDNFFEIHLIINCVIRCDNFWAGNVILEVFSTCKKNLLKKSY